MAIKSFKIYSKKVLDKKFEKEAQRKLTKDEILNNQIMILVIITIVVWMAFMGNILDWIAYHI